jgi:hypothetical protein
MALLSFVTTSACRTKFTACRAWLDTAAVISPIAFIAPPVLQPVVVNYLSPAAESGTQPYVYLSDQTSSFRTSPPAVGRRDPDAHAACKVRLWGRGSTACSAQADQQPHAPAKTALRLERRNPTLTRCDSRPRSYQQLRVVPKRSITSTGGALDPSSAIPTSEPWRSTLRTTY